jgi:HEAT repeat protein
MPRHNSSKRAIFSARGKQTSITATVLRDGGDANGPLVVDREASPGRDSVQPRVRRNMRTAPAAALIVLSVSVAHAQKNPDPFDPAVAVPKAWALLTPALESTALSDQSAALRALAGAGTPQTLEVVERVARERSHRLRSSAIWLLPAGNATHLPLLAEALKDADLEVRRSAIQQLGRINDPRTLPLLQNFIMSGDADTIEWAIGSARLLGPLAYGVLLQAIETGPERSRESAIRCIEWLVGDDWVTGQPSTEKLEALRRLGPERILIKALGDSNRSVRAFAALILARLGDASGTDELIRMVEASDPRFGTIISRHYAMAALHALGRPGYLAPLAAALEHAEPRVRQDAAMAMRSFASPSMYDIWNATWRGDSPSDVRYWAFHGLIAIRGTDAKLLRAGLVDRNAAVRFRAAERLLALGPDSASLDVLEQLVAEPATRNALSILATKGNPRRTAALARSLLPKSADDLAHMRSGHVYDPEYRLSAVYALEVVRDREAVPLLDAVLALGPDLELPFRVVRALVAIGDDAARRALVRAMDSPHSVVRLHAAGGVVSLYAR